MPNRLAQATSPYLQQHAGNPVDWYEWGPEALERARREHKPILLSIGYAACHWCHVMAHESFENDEIAALMNAHFVNIKVDREERPDLDAIYMQAVQAMTGHGGWPMTVFLTPEGIPFYGGTYWPPADRHGMPGFPRVLRTLRDAYHDQPDAIRSTTTQLQQMFAAVQQPTSATAVTETTLRRMARELAAAFDRAHGGFGGAPKFPPSMTLEFLLTSWARTGDDEALAMVLQTFRAMARGGIYDQLGGGLHRYSVDGRWLVPHFEKMLYDNALLLRLGVHLFQATQDAEVATVCREIVSWVAREMTAPGGGFFSSLDADSEGHEGTFYVWTADELRAELGDDAPLLQAAWGVTAAGNFEGKNVLHRPLEETALADRFALSADEVATRVSRARSRLLEKRAHRVWPARDDKIVASWNGLMLRALAEYARVFGEKGARDAALANGRFLVDKLVRSGRVLRAWRDDRALEVGFLEDQGAVALGLLELYTLTADAHWLTSAREITERMVRDFFDRERGVFFDTPADHEALITRPRDATDNALPSGTSLAAELLLRLGIIDGRAEWSEVSPAIVEQTGEALVRHPQAFGHLAVVADAVVYGAIEVVVVGEPGHSGRRALELVASTTYLPAGILLAVSDATADDTALGRHRRTVAGQPMAHVCRSYVCDAPTADPKVLAAQLKQALRASSKPEAGGTSLAP